MGPTTLRFSSSDGRNAADVAGDGSRGQRLQSDRHDVRGNKEFYLSLYPSSLNLVFLSDF